MAKHLTGELWRKCKGKSPLAGSVDGFRCLYTCQWGTLPSVATVTVPLSDQTKVQRIGDLVLVMTFTSRYALPIAS